MVKFNYESWKNFFLQPRKVTLQSSFDEKQVINKVRGIEFKAKRKISNSTIGKYHSAFKGQGIEFDVVRDYQEGDEERLIDWNVTARMSEPYVKNFIEERENSLIFMVDISASTVFGTQKQFKNELIADVCCFLAFNAFYNNDRCGLALFTNQIELFLKPQKGKNHIMRMIRELLYFKPQNFETDIANSLNHLNQSLKKTTVIFLFSDFASEPSYYRELIAIKKKHDIIVLNVQDPLELDFPDCGIVELQDLESGKIFVLDSGNRADIKKYCEQREAERKKLQDFLTKNKIENLFLKTNQDYQNALLHFFRKKK